MIKLKHYLKKNDFLIKNIQCHKSIYDFTFLIEKLILNHK